MWVYAQTVKRLRARYLENQVPTVDMLVNTDILSFAPNVPVYVEQRETILVYITVRTQLKPRIS